MYHLACSVTFKLACSVTFDEQVLYLFQQDMVTIVATSFHTCILHYKMSHRPPANTIQRWLDCEGARGLPGRGRADVLRKNRGKMDISAFAVNLMDGKLRRQ